MAAAESQKVTLRVSPGSPLARFAGLRRRVVLPATFRRVCRKKRPMPPSAWAERYRYLDMAQERGRWRNERTPYLAGIMDAAAWPFLRTIILCKTPQVGGSEMANNLLGYWADMDPGPAMLVYPDEKTARENSQDRIQPLFRTSPALRQYISSVSDDTANFRINLLHMPVYFAWARSVSSLANKPIRFIIFDETDKYPLFASKREADPISLGEDRTTTFRHTRKILKISTPTIEEGPIWKALMEEAEEVFRFFACCPFCQRLQVLEFDQVVFPGREKAEEGSPEEASLLARRIKGQGLARYKCRGCAREWDDLTRDEAVRLGKWMSDSGEGLEDARKKRLSCLGFHLPSLVSPFVSLSEAAADWLKSRHDPAAVRKFYNKHLAEPWRQVVTGSREEEVLEARDDGLPAKTVPSSAVALTAFVDVQKYGFWYAVRAWARDYSSWLVDYGRLETWEDVSTLLFATAWPIQGAEKLQGMRVWRAAVDTGGGKGRFEVSTTEQTYFWLRDNGRRPGRARVWGTKGATSRIEGLIRMGKPFDRTPSGRPLKGGLLLMHLDTHALKDIYFWRLEAARAGGTMGLYLHGETGADYARQVCAEEKRINERGIEEWVQIRRDNHYLDCEVGCIALAEPAWFGGIRALGGRPHMLVDISQDQPSSAASDSAAEGLRTPPGRPGGNAARASSNPWTRGRKAIWNKRA